MKRSMILGVALVSIASGALGLAGAVVIAQAQEPVPIPRYASYNPPPLVAGGGDPPLSLPQEPASPPEISTPDDPVFGDLLDEPPPIASSPIAESRSSESLDSNEFIDKGQSLASEAINTLTAERDSLRERLEQIDQELARWNAIQAGLSSAKEATPTDGLPEDTIDLTPLPEPAR